MFVDAHIHLAEYNDKDLKVLLRQLKDFRFIGVSSNIYESFKTIAISNLFENVIPAIGIHPWEVKENFDIDKALKEIEKLIVNNKVPILGEIGLDKRFNKENYQKQKELFQKFLELAREYDLRVNLHCLDSYKECLELLERNKIEKAYFHWYNGPLDLIPKIVDNNYFIGINLAIFKQEKHKKVLEETPIEFILTESDAPYEYKGEILTPKRIPELISYIAKVKEESEEKVKNTILKNFRKYLY